jgi:hypothetical protein
MPLISKKGLEISDDIVRFVINLWGNFQIPVIMNYWTVVRAMILSSLIRKVMDCA